MADKQERTVERLTIGTDGRYHGGFLVERGGRWYLVDRKRKSSVVFGPPGSGKATDVILVDLLCGGGGNGQSLVLADTKLEICAVVAKQLRALGMKTFKLKPFPLLDTWPYEDMRTHRFNPIASGPGPDDPDFENYVNALTEGLVVSSTHEPFFTDGAKKLLSGIIAFVRTLPLDLQTFTSVYRILQARGADHLLYMRDMAACGVELARVAAAMYLGNEPTKGAQEILETLGVQLAFLGVPGIRYVLDGPSDFTWADVKRGNVAVFFGLPAAEAHMYGRLTRMFFAGGLKACLTEPREPGVRFIIDEAGTALGGQTLSQLEAAMALGRGYGVSIAPLVFQSYPQARAVLGKDHVDAILATAATQVWLTPNDEASAGVISRRAGQRTVVDLEYSLDPKNSAQLVPGWRPNGHGIGMPVLNPHALYGFPSNKLIAFREGVSNAIVAWRVPYTSIPALNAVANINPYAPPTARKTGTR